MATKLASKRWSDAQLMSLPDVGRRYELVNGKVRLMAPAGWEHGDIVVLLSARISNFAMEHNLGRVLSPDTGFRMGNGDVRSPDVSFVVSERMKGMTRLPRGFVPGGPDLAVEVLSPKESLASTERKVQQFFENGTRLAWIIRPKSRTVLVYEPGKEPVRLDADGLLDGGTIVPGFSMPVSKLFLPPNAG